MTTSQLTTWLEPTPKMLYIRNKPQTVKNVHHTIAKQYQVLRPILIQQTQHLFIKTLIAATRFDAC